MMYTCIFVLLRRKYLTRFMRDSYFVCHIYNINKVRGKDFPVCSRVRALCWIYSMYAPIMHIRLSLFWCFSYAGFTLVGEEKKYV